MAGYLANPQYGIVPGAPQYLNWWSGPGGTQFNMSGLPANPPPPPPPPPEKPPGDTPQDRVTQQAAAQLVGGQGGGGGVPGGRDSTGSGGGRDMSTSGVQGVYADPLNVDSRFGSGAGVLGTLSGVPGLGVGAGVAGSVVDAARLGGALDQAGVPHGFSPWSGVGYGLASSVGIPFTDLNLARAFGIASPQQLYNAAITAARAAAPMSDTMYGPPDIASASWGINQANQPVDPVTRESTQYASYPAGFMAAQAPINALNLDVARSIAANPDLFAGVEKGAFDPGSWGEAYSGKGGIDPGGSTGSASDKGNVGAGQDQGSGGTSGWGGDKDSGDAYRFRGGLIGAPPRFAGGGAVRAAGRMPTRSEAEFIPLVPRDTMSDFAPGWDEYFPGGGRRDAQPDASGQLSPRERAIQDFMIERGIAREREVFPEQLAAGGTVGPGGGANITPAQFGLLRGIDPPGPDDQIAAVKTGEGVMTRASMQKYPGLLNAANKGTLNPTHIQGMLASRPKARR